MCVYIICIDIGTLYKLSSFSFYSLVGNDEGRVDPSSCWSGLWSGLLIRRKHPSQAAPISFFFFLCPWFFFLVHFILVENSRSNLPYTSRNTVRRDEHKHSWLLLLVTKVKHTDADQSSREHSLREHPRYIPRYSLNTDRLFYLFFMSQ